MTRLVGPYLVNGGWWNDPQGRSVSRAYHFAETTRGHCLWLYYDPIRTRWFLSGAVD